MRIGILSDTHNDHSVTQRALQAFKQRGVKTLFHCGDLTAPEVLEHFADFEVYVVRGNMDRHNVDEIRARAKRQPGVHWLGRGEEVELKGKRIAITHGDRDEVYERLLAAEPDYLLVGHTHRRKEERIGPTLVINPGAVGGIQHEERSVCVLELETGELEHVQL